VIAVNRITPSIGLPWDGRRLHIVGVGGAGMSAYARAAKALGASVTGSDRADSPFSAGLRADGVVDARIGHDPGNLPAGDALEVFHSSAIEPDNVELVAARERGLRVGRRAELLGELSRLRRTIGVAGAHGKTTTASMIAVALRGCGLDPGYLIGGTLRETGRNGEWGTGEWLVVEADESDLSMLSLDVEIGVLTSVELDHHAAFGSLLELEGVYREFLAGPEIAVIWERPELLALRDGPLVAYDAPQPALVGGGSEFDFRGRQVKLRVPGVHNAVNATAALEVCRLVGADLDRAIAALADFGGAGRRFELLGETRRGAVVYDDYAHHPTELRATLAAARTLGQVGDGTQGSHSHHQVGDGTQGDHSHHQVGDGTQGSHSHHQVGDGTQGSHSHHQVGGGTQGSHSHHQVGDGTQGNHSHQGGRVVAVFQPHLYSRTEQLAREFGEALAGADVVVVVDVYPARERAADFPGVTGRMIAAATVDAGPGRAVYWLPGFDVAERVLDGLLVGGDVCLVIGAGDVDRLGRRLVA